MALPGRRSFSKEPSDIHLSGVLSSNKELFSMHEGYQCDPKLPISYSYLPALEYLDNYAALPSYRPVGFPHLINTEKYYEENQRQDLRVADAVVTVLYNWEPEALAAFLDMDREDFRFRVEDSKVYPHNFYIQRKYNRVECGYVGYESHEYRIEESGEWTPLSVIVQIRDLSKENHLVPNGSASNLHQSHVTCRRKPTLVGSVPAKATVGDVKKARSNQLQGTCHGARFRMGFIDKVQQEAMINDGAKLADDVLSLPVWAASPSITFKTIGVQLSRKRPDTEALDL